MHRIDLDYAHVAMTFAPAPHHIDGAMNTTPERLSVTFGAARLAFLQAEAARLDIGIGELLRRLVDQYHEQRDRVPQLKELPR